MQIITLSLESISGRCDFCSFLSWSISLWFLVKYRDSRSVQYAEISLHKLDVLYCSVSFYVFADLSEEKRIKALGLLQKYVYKLVEQEERKVLYQNDEAE